MTCEVDWLEGRARLYPNEDAVIDSGTGQSWTYQELNQRASDLAGAFKKKNVKKGDRVALFAPNHICYLDALFACSKIGAIFVPLNWRLAVKELNYILKDSAPVLLMVHEQHKEKVRHLPSIKQVVPFKDNDYLDQMEQCQSFQPEKNRKLTEPLAIIYTGGTTGAPKGVVLTHQSIFTNAVNTILSWNLTNKDTTYTSLPMFHTGGLNALTIPMLLAGGRVVLASSFDPESAIQALLEYKCTIVLFVPTMYHMIVQSETFKRETFPDIEVFLSGGAPCPLKVYQAFEQKGLKFKEGYGLTEAGPNNFFIEPEEALKRPGSVGKPMVLNKIKIITPTGKEAQPDEVGELLISGNHTFDYYWNKQKATEQTWKKGWLHTGDLAKRDASGFVYIVGRKKEMIITGGENVYPLEIEHCLGEHPQVNEAAVVGFPDDKWGEIVVAFVSLKQKGTLTASGLRAYCGKQLGGYKVPKQFCIIDELPKTDVGKIDKKALFQQFNKSTV